MSKKHTATSHYDIFVKEIEDAERRILFIPKDELTNKKLIPTAKRRPCDHCTRAEKNAFCVVERSCGAYLYWICLYVNELGEGRIAKLFREKLEELKNAKVRRGSQKSTGRKGSQRRANSRS